MNEKELNNAYEKLKRQQEQLEPYMPIRYMAEVLGTESHRHVQDILKKLIETGRAVRVKFGETVRYRIL